MGRLEALALAAKDQKWPPLDAWTPKITRDFGLTITRDGLWHYLGSPIERHSLVKVLSRVLRKEGGNYFLLSPVEKLRIEVEDAPFVAVEVERIHSGEQQKLVFRTNVDDVVIADASHPIRVAEKRDSGEPAPYIAIRDGLEALMTRPVFYELAEMAQPARDGQSGVYGVWSAGQFFPLGRIDA